MQYSIMICVNDDIVLNLSWLSEYATLLV